MHYNPDHTAALSSAEETPTMDMLQTVYDSQHSYNDLSWDHLESILNANSYPATATEVIPQEVGSTGPSASMYYLLEEEAKIESASSSDMPYAAAAYYSTPNDNLANHVDGFPFDLQARLSPYTDSSALTSLPPLNVDSFAATSHLMDEPTVHHGMDSSWTSYGAGIFFDNARNIATAVDEGGTPHGLSETFMRHANESVFNSGINPSWEALSLSSSFSEPYKLIEHGFPMNSTNLPFELAVNFVDHRKLDPTSDNSAGIDEVEIDGGPINSEGWPASESLWTHPIRASSTQSSSGRRFKADGYEANEHYSEPPIERGKKQVKSKVPYTPINKEEREAERLARRTCPKCNWVFAGPNERDRHANYASCSEQRILFPCSVEGCTSKFVRTDAILRHQRECKSCPGFVPQEGGGHEETGK